ncbi:MAG: hypothetical protein GY711_21355 [bacterium]|nr:hypothetical protein [bacterium]
MPSDLHRLCPELSALWEVDNWTWRSRRTADAGWIDALTQRLADESPSTPFKDGVERFVKRTPLVGLRRRLRASLRLSSLRSGRKGPILEAVNSLEAHRAGGPVPELLALGETPASGLRREVVLVFEAIAGARSLHEVFASDAPPEPTLDRVESLVQSLMQLPLVHLDFHGHNVLLSDAGEAGDRVVDLEMCAPTTPRRPDVLAFYLGNLWRRGASGVIDEPIYDMFAQGFLGDCTDAEALPRAIERYRDFKAVRYRFRQRRHLLRG